MSKVLMLMLLMGACAHVPQGWNPQKNAATQRAHQQVIEELQEQGRTPASPILETGAKLSDLNRVKPGKFAIYVFPKIQDQNRKSQQGDETYLGKPRAFEVSLIAENPCKQFIQRGLFAGLKPQEVFPSDLAESNERRCAILEVTDLKLKNQNRSLLRQSDLLQTRLFLDDTYRVHATDKVLYDGAGKTVTVRSLNREGDAAFSALTLYPIDLPPRGAQVRAGEQALTFSPLLDEIAIFQIQRLQRNFVAPRCEGKTLNYLDNYGAAVKVGWCQGLPWPQYSENSRFFSVTQPLTLGGVQ